MATGTRGRIDPALVLTTMKIFACLRRNAQFALGCRGSVHRSSWHSNAIPGIAYVDPDRSPHLMQQPFFDGLESGLIPIQR